MLICPKCHEQLKKEEHVWRCAKGHSYDIARRGYVNLVLGSHKASGDDKAMVRSRTRFLSHGYYHIMQKRLATMLQKLALETLIDAGCGFRVIIVTVANSLGNIKVFELLPKLKTKKYGWCIA